MNQIQIPVADLKPVLQGLSKVIQKRSTLPVLACVLMECTDQGVRFTGTNLDDFLFREIKTDPAGGLFKRAVPLESLNRIVKGCSADATLTITPAKDELRIAYPVGGTTINDRISTIEATEFPHIRDCQFTTPVEVGLEFKQALLLAFQSCSEDSSRYILQHAYVDVSDPKAHYVVATNGREMFCANSLQLGFKKSLIVPQRKFLTWNGFVDDGDWSVGLSVPAKGDASGWVKVQSQHWTLITKQIEGAYPNWKAPIPSKDTTTTLRFSEEACEFLKLAASKLPGHEESLRPVTLMAIDSGSLVIRAGKGQDAILVPVTGVSAEGVATRITMNREYLLKALKLGLTELHVYEPNIPVVFRNGGRLLVIAPMRTDESDTPEPTKETTPAQVNGSAAPVSLPSEPEPEEMKTINRIEDAQPATETAPHSAFVQVKDQLESLKDRLKAVVGDLNDTIKLLATAQKEKKATEREIEGIRETLRGLQQVRI